MKLISVFRHGKSSWKYPVKDIYRPLSGRGLRQVTQMAQDCQLALPDLLLSSPASRTSATALIYIEELGLQWQTLYLEPGLYEADGQQLLEVFSALDDGVNNLWCFGHNPGLNQVASALLGQAINNIVTAEYVSLSLDIENWSQIGDDCAQLLEIRRPTKT